MSDEASNSKPPQEQPPAQPPGNSDTSLIKKDENQTVAAFLEEQAPELLKEIPPKAVSGLKRVVIQQRITRSGPLPDPLELEAYSKCVPDGANRIVAMAEAQSNHRMEIERLVITSQQGLASRGQIMAFIIAIVGLVSALFAAVKGQATFASILATTTIAALVTAFLAGKKDEKDDSGEKQRQMAVILAQQSEITRLRERTNRRKK